MVDTVRIRTEGFAELAERLKQLPQRVAKNALRRAVSSGAAVVRNEARTRAPVDTGKLRKDIQIKREKDQRGTFAAKYSVFVRGAKKKKAGAAAAPVQTTSFYWKFIEFGTSKMPAQPFLAPAFDTKKEEALKTIGEKLDEGIQKAARELAGR